MGGHGVSRVGVTTVTRRQCAQGGSLVRVRACRVWGPGLAAASCAALGGWGGGVCVLCVWHTQLHRDENSKCGWVAKGTVAMGASRGGVLTLGGGILG